MTHVGHGVGLLGGRERACRPVVLLPGRRKRHPETLRQEGVEAESVSAEEARRDRRVEDRREGQAVPALEMGEVVVAGVEHDQAPGASEHGPQGRQVLDRQRVDEPGLAGREGELQERQPVRVVVEAVAFGVERDLALGAESAGERDEVGCGPDPGDGGRG